MSEAVTKSCRYNGWREWSLLRAGLSMKIFGFVVDSKQEGPNQLQVESGHYESEYYVHFTVLYAIVQFCTQLYSFVYNCNKECF